MEHIPNGKEGCDERDDEWQRRERLYGPEDVKKALKVFLARMGYEEPNIAKIARDMSLPPSPGARSQP